MKRVVYGGRPKKYPRLRFVLNGRNEQNGAPQQFCFDFDVLLNRKGNIEVVVEDIDSSFVPFFKSKSYVFDRDGFCISHQPSKRYRYHNQNAQLRLPLE